MKGLRWTLKLHKWIALIIGLQILAWVLGGLVFSILDIEKVRGEHKIAEQPHLPLTPESIITLKEAVKMNRIVKVHHASLGRMVNRPVWRIMIEDEKHLVIDGLSGEILSPISFELATEIAEADYGGTGEISSVAYVEHPPTEYPHKGAAWVAKFDDRDNTTLYIHPDSAEVKSRRSTTWRIFDFFWKLHVMDYDDGENFNHPLLVGAAFIALGLVLSGFILLFVRLRRKWLIRRALRGSEASAASGED